jgi:cytochrome c2
MAAVTIAALALAWLQDDDAGLPRFPPGLVAIYRSGDAALTRLDPKPCFTWGDSSPHPRLPPGPFRVTWTGLLVCRDTGPLRFGARLGGELTMEIDGAVVLRGRGDTDELEASAPFVKDPGTYPVRIEFRSLERTPARVQLTWEGPHFSREPIPPWLFRHDPKQLPDSARDEAAGRAAAIRLGCARCHRSAFPSINEPPPGPSLADVGARIGRGALRRLLAHPGPRMPRLFTDDRDGFVERWIVAEHLAPAAPPPAPAAGGDHRHGKLAFLKLGCVACHFVPDADPPEPPDPERTTLTATASRWTVASLAAFLKNPAQRYPDGRMPRLPPQKPEADRDIAAYLLLHGAPEAAEADDPAPSPQEIETTLRRLGASDPTSAAVTLMRRKRCASCHENAETDDAPIGDVAKGCTGASFQLDEKARRSLTAFVAVARSETHPSPVEDRRRLLARLGCGRCHARDDEGPSPLEKIGATLGGSNLERLPFQHTPRLTYALSKYRRDYLTAAIRDGAPGARPNWYSYRMPAYADQARAIAGALAEADGEPLDEPPERPAAAEDPTLASVGPSLVGFGGYSCVSCHQWNGKALADAAPGAAGPELTSVTRRVRRAWFDRWLDDPGRLHPGTPMPAIFSKGQPAKMAAILGADAARQRDAMWAYFERGAEMPPPKPLPPLAMEPPLAAQIPVHLPDGAVVESLTLLTSSNDLVVYDLASLRLREVYTGARLLRTAAGRVRGFRVEGTPVGGFGGESALEGPFLGYDRLPDGVRIRARGGELSLGVSGRALIRGTARLELPPAATPPPIEPATLAATEPAEGSLQRPGYRALAYPRLKGPAGEDRLMPSAVAVDPRSGRVFVASMKQGRLFALEEGSGEARWMDYTGGLFEEPFAMLHDGADLFVLHRKNLTRVRDTDGDGRADAFDRIAGLPHGTADTYDYGYGLVRERDGAFILSYAPYADRRIPGAGSVLRLTPGQPARAEEIAFGLRNPLGWCAGPEGQVFFTDNQGEWVATNKLCHVVPGRFYGFPIAGRPEAPLHRAAVWVPYAWARSINGVTYDATGGAFGPFAGQFFMAELMYGGAIIRANLESVNGQLQGACFPFWGKGLLGPLVLAFDPAGRLTVGSITEPGWMSQPDRGGLFRIDFTGETPFEIRSIHAGPRGFRLVFTRPADAATAGAATSYRVEHYRYEYTGAYGSPELDRTPVSVQRAAPTPDGRAVDLIVDPLVRDRVYRIHAGGVRSTQAETLVHPEGAYTLNEIPGP